MKLRLACALLCLPALLSARDLLNEQFDQGISAWTVDSGKAFKGPENNGTLIFRSIKGPDTGNQPGSVSRLLTGLTPGENYELFVDFRFEKNFPDTWPWAMVTVESASPRPGSGPSVIVDHRISTRKRAGSGPDDSAWRTISLPFNPGKATSVIIRLSNNPSMMDQTHWDNIRLAPLNP
jgi:hypothetical protein